MQSPVFSVVMNCLNCAEYLREAIDSVYAQTFRDWEIVLWDNASKDDISGVAHSYDDRLRYFCGEETVPLGEARGFALERASGELIAFLDCDDTWMPEKLAKQLQCFRNNPGAGLVYSDYLNLDQQGRTHRGYREGLPPRGRVFRQLMAGYFLVMSTVAVRRDALYSLDERFDPRLTILEETDLFTRLSYVWEIERVPEPLAVYRLHDEQWTLKGRARTADEVDIFVEKLCTLEDEFAIRYGQELAALHTDAAYKRALVDWEAGLGRQARARLRPHLAKRRRLWAVYVASYFPYTLYPLFVGLRRRWRASRDRIVRATSSAGSSSRRT